MKKSSSNNENNHKNMDAMKIANSIPMWLACALPVAFVILQAVLFARGAYKSGKKLGLNDKQMKKAMKSSAVTSIGPSIVVLSAMLSLLVSVGGPIGWMRLSMIGSVMFESIAAGLGTSAVGVQLGTDTLTPEALGMAVWTMILCSIGWALFATFSANKMDKIEKKVSRGNTGTLTTIASCAIIGVFSAMCASHLSKPFYSMMMKADQITMSGAWKNALACVLGAVIMFVLTKVANKKEIGWLKEWSLTITIGAILGTSVLSMLPDTIKAALNYLLPALFGALLVQFGMKMKKHSVIMVVFAIILYFMIGMGYFNWLPGASNWLGTLGCVFVSIAIGMATLKNATKE